MYFCSLQGKTRRWETGQMSVSLCAPTNQTLISERIDWGAETQLMSEAAESVENVSFWFHILQTAKIQDLQLWDERGAVNASPFLQLINVTLSFLLFVSHFRVFVASRCFRSLFFLLSCLLWLVLSQCSSFVSLLVSLLLLSVTLKPFRGFWFHCNSLCQFCFSWTQFYFISCFLFMCPFTCSVSCVCVIVASLFTGLLILSVIHSFGVAVSYLYLFLFVLCLKWFESHCRSRASLWLFSVTLK